jgi:hypothetical protein
MEKIAAEIRIQWKIINCHMQTLGETLEFSCQDWEHCSTITVLEQILTALVNAHYELIHVDTGKSDKVFFPLTNISKRAKLRQVNFQILVVEGMKCS